MFKVLLADDENIEIEYLCSVFNSIPYKEKYRIVATASNGMEAVEKAEKFNPHIVITDIKMPLMNGIEAATQIKKTNPEIIVILNTAYAEFEFAKKAIENHFDAYMLKPTTGEEIIKVIEKSILDSKIACENIKDTNKNEFPIEIAKKYIEKNLSSKLTLGDIASKVYFAPSHFSKVFRETEGITLSKFINERRISLSKEYILNSEKTIKDISILCGFSNISNFNRVFKQQTGKTPVQFRKGK